MTLLLNRTAVRELLDIDQSLTASRGGYLTPPGGIPARRPGAARTGA